MFGSTGVAVWLGLGCGEGVTAVTAVGVAETNAVIVRTHSADLKKIFMMLQKYSLKLRF
jgi:hypothetical protein